MVTAVDENLITREPFPAFLKNLNEGLEVYVTDLFVFILYWSLYTGVASSQVHSLDLQLYLTEI